MKNKHTHYKSVLTIAGSDSGGCAGIQADIKSISACGAYAASVITTTTAQNTQRVTDIHTIPITHIAKQLDAVFSDISFKAIKIGMLHSCEIISLVQNKLAFYKPKNIVLDPVMVATSGDKLISDNAIDCLKKLLPNADLITPNIFEAQLLLGSDINIESIETSAIALGQSYNTSVLLKGGHLDSIKNNIIDVLYNHQKKTTTIIKNIKIDTPNTHGTGCTLSSSIATYLALENNLDAAVAKGCSYTNQVIREGQYKILGKGRGPVNHFKL